MSRKIKKSYRIREVDTGEYISVGYNRKSSWNAFPSEAISNHSYLTSTPGRFVVDVFELVYTDTLDLDKNKIQ